MHVHQSQLHRSRLVKGQTEQNLVHGENIVRDSSDYLPDDALHVLDARWLEGLGRPRLHRSSPVHEISILVRGKRISCRVQGEMTRSRRGEGKVQ